MYTFNRYTTSIDGDVNLVRPVIEVIDQFKNVRFIITCDDAFEKKKFSWDDAYGYSLYTMSGEMVPFPGYGPDNTSDTFFIGQLIEVLATKDLDAYFTQTRQFEIAVFNNIGQKRYVHSYAGGLALTSYSLQYYSEAEVKDILNELKTKTFSELFPSSRKLMGINIKPAPVGFVVKDNEKLSFEVVCVNEPKNVRQ